MNAITRLMYMLHRTLGTLFCLLFLAWFLSAFVMMYHRFPRISAKERLQRMERLSAGTDSLPDIRSVTARLPRGESVQKVTLNRRMGQTLFHIRTRKGTYDLPANATEPLRKIDRDFVKQAAAQWCEAAVTRIDTLRKLDQWIPFSNLKEEMPIYKITFADEAGTELYLSSRTGEALQCSTRNERFWAWVGAIPHWVYFSSLRQNDALWSRTVIWLSGIGCLMVIAGIWVTADVWRKARRRRLFSPYRKRWYHWHYVSGIFFGIFVLTFTFSGMMSLADLPEWIHKPAMQHSPTRLLRAGAPKAERYALDYRAVIAAHPDVVQIEWNNFRQHAYYTATDGKREYYIDAADSLPRPLHLSEAEIRQAIEAVYRADTASQHPLPQIRLTQIEQFETYYRDMSSMYRGRPQLPVWKAETDDADHSVYYIHPETGIVRYVNTAARWKYWSYTALHRMRLPGLNSNGTLRKGVLWVLLAGGSVVSVTGVALSIKYLRRTCRRKKKRHYHS